MPQRLTPKARFLADKEASKRWYDLCGDPALHRVLETALAELATQLIAGNASEAVMSHYQMAGAKRFIDVVLNLGEAVKPLQGVTEPVLQ